MKVVGACGAAADCVSREEHVFGDWVDGYTDNVAVNTSKDKDT